MAQRQFGLYAMIALLAFIAYGPVLWNGAGFSHPDDPAAAQLKCCSFRPLLALTYEFNSRFGGWMAVNFMLHLTAAWLVLYLAGPVAASLFAVHPMAADAVASVSGRSGLLLAVGVLGAMALYQRRKAVGIALGMLAVLGAASFGTSYLGTIHGSPGYSDYALQLWAQVGNVFAKAFIPIGLTGEPAVHSPTPSELFALIGVASWVWICTPDSRLARLGAALLALPILPYFLIPLPNGFYEHRAYLSLAGASILIALSLKKAPRLAYAVIPMFLVLAMARTQVYSSPVRLWEDAARLTPESGRIRINLGAVYGYDGRWYEAEDQFQKAVRDSPEIAMGWTNLAAVYIARSNFGEASRVMDARDAYLNSKNER